MRKHRLLKALTMAILAVVLGFFGGTPSADEAVDPSTETSNEVTIRVSGEPTCDPGLAVLHGSVPFHVTGPSVTTGELVVTDELGNDTSQSLITGQGGTTSTMFTGLGVGKYTATWTIGGEVATTEFQIKLCEEEVLPPPVVATTPPTAEPTPSQQPAATSVAPSTPPASTPAVLAETGLSRSNMAWAIYGGFFLLAIGLALASLGRRPARRRN